MVKLLGETADGKESIFNDHMKHVLVHYHIIVAFNALERVCHNRDQQVNQHDLEEEGRNHEKEPRDLVVVVPVDVRIEVSQSDFVNIRDGLSHCLETMSL